MLDWSKVKKIGAHIHILPDCVHEMNPDSDPEESWTYAKIDDYIKIMDLFHIEKAIIMPLNDPYLLSTNFTISAVHKNLFDMKRVIPIVSTHLQISIHVIHQLFLSNRFASQSLNMA